MAPKKLTPKKKKPMQDGTLIDNSTALSSRNEEVRKELTAIANRKSGLNPTTVLNVAKNPRSCLHKYFCWDDTEAARRFREQQAYELIRSVKVTIETPDKKEVTVRAFFPVKAVGADGTIDYRSRGNYLPTSEITADEEAVRQVMARAKSERMAFTVKYQALSAVMDFQEVFDAIRKTLTPRLN
jgi:hypothetical protein